MTCLVILCLTKKKKEIIIIKTGERGDHSFVCCSWASRRRTFLYLASSSIRNSSSFVGYMFL
jgi:hypothetical protein